MSTAASEMNESFFFSSSRVTHVIKKNVLFVLLGD